MKKWMKRKNYTAQSKKHLRDKNLQEAAKVLSLMQVDDAESAVRKSGYAGDGERIVKRKRS